MEFPRGSEWRKWDLHVHAPGTKLADAYAKHDGGPDWDRFCQIIHDSDVAGIGITDYFSFDGFFAFKAAYESRYPDDKSKVFFPNLELRLNEVLNDLGQNVNIHLILRPDLSQADANRLLSDLKTEVTAGKSNRPVSCADLKSVEQFESATVSRDGLMNALRQTFGSASPIEEFALVVASAKGDGIRPGGRGSKKRKNALVDEIDKVSSAFFAGPSSKKHFLDTGRLDSQEKVASKPVFDGCDAHSFDDLEGRLGRHNTEKNPVHHTTWVKADLTYEGLLQTLVEPEHRVAIQATEPDSKEPYQYISRITFSGTNDFPTEVVFNRNLNSIIGSRSSGKSALLAYVAHAVDPDMTVRQQVDASGLLATDVGPAPGKTWADVEDVDRSLEWGSPAAEGGKIIYIPQNSLFAISEHPEKINSKIEPSLFRAFPMLKSAYDQAQDGLSSIYKDIDTSVDKWFALSDEIDRKLSEAQAIGDRKAIAAERDELQVKIDDLRAKAQFSADEIRKHEDVSLSLRQMSQRSEDLRANIAKLSQYAILDEGQTAARPIQNRVQVAIDVTPSASHVPREVAVRIDQLRTSVVDDLKVKVEQELTGALLLDVTEQLQLASEIEGIKAANSELFAKHEANAELATIVASHTKQAQALDQIARLDSDRSKLESARAVQEAKVVESIKQRAEVLDQLKKSFELAQPSLDGMAFGVEIGFDAEAIEKASAAFDRRRVSAYLPSRGDSIKVEIALGESTDFLHAIRSETLSLNTGNSKQKTAKYVLTLEPEVRFTAVLEGDRIGGFSRSTMTQGKQALFALTLILNESQEPWPLLIDQPEDDLDSRSIYEAIVPYLVTRKCERQIIMVSHDANLVVGADSEEVIVANRHGADRPNKDDRTFEYLSGSLEHSQTRNEKSRTILGRCGIREHACEILDGGELAFQKRKDKYKI